MHDNVPLPMLDQRKLPREVERLRELAYNLWWSWHEDAQELYRSLDPLLWEEVRHNPVAFLRRVSPGVLDAAIGDPLYMAHYKRILRTYDVYMGESDTWFLTTYPDLKDQVIAYFSTEFGLHESLPLYAGGLGVLSGDHAKEASDLGLPFVGVGLLYHQGYFVQEIDADGWQQDYYEDLNVADLPLCPASTPDGREAIVSCELNGLNIQSRVWEVWVGRVPVYLLDTDLKSDRPEITDPVKRLYGGSRETRLLQEMLLGLGGVMALRVLGIHPHVWHINEGHAAFMTLELAREYAEEGLTFDEATQRVKETCVFTTHTSVPAGQDMFGIDLIERYCQTWWKSLGLTREQFVDLARHDEGGCDMFSMPCLALRFSSWRNAVSRLHGEVSRELFSHVWPKREGEEEPITYITNGIHTETWLAPEMARLFEEYVGPDWIHYLDDPDLWDAVDAIPDSVLWEVRQVLKRKMLAALHRHAQKRWLSGKTTPKHVLWAGALIDQGVLTIGFARRFATYKRATLVFHDMERLKKIVTNVQCPVQFIFAGKAHPNDDAGKQLIREICTQALDHGLAGRIAFLEDYDMGVARYLVRGVDVWLNNPRCPREASGTSGQKAALNGVPSLSILDGWWEEGYNGRNGWAIGDGRVLSEDASQDHLDALDLYDALERKVVPFYYRRDAESGLPHDWLTVVREAIKSAAPYFSARRMLKDYTDRMYVPVLSGVAGGESSEALDMPVADGR
jgi:starch phosphorylase